jgi:hypothetical protein
MQKGAKIGQEWPHGLIPCKSPSMIDACSATTKVMVVAESIEDSFLRIINTIISDHF